MVNGCLSNKWLIYHPKSDKEEVYRVNIEIRYCDRFKIIFILVIIIRLVVHLSRIGLSEKGTNHTDFIVSLVEVSIVPVHRVEVFRHDWISMAIPKAMMHIQFGIKVKRRQLLEDGLVR